MSLPLRGPFWSLTTGHPIQPPPQSLFGGNRHLSKLIRLGGPFLAMTLELPCKEHRFFDFELSNTPTTPRTFEAGIDTYRNPFDPKVPFSNPDDRNSLGGTPNFRFRFWECASIRFRAINVNCEKSSWKSRVQSVFFFWFPARERYASRQPLPASLRQ